MYNDKSHMIGAESKYISILSPPVPLQSWCCILHLYRLSSCLSFKNRQQPKHISLESAKWTLS